MKCEKYSNPFFTGCYIVGPTGPKGEPGATIEVGKTTTGEPGMPASVTNKGTNENVILDFVIPRGEVGPPPNLEIGTVETGSPGTQASVKITPIDDKEKEKSYE